MALPRRKRRTIVVDGVRYHWTRGQTPENMWVTVQPEEGGSLLRIDTYGIPLPADISEAIRFAKKHGWSPDVPNSHFYLGYNASAGSERFVVKTARSPDFWRECESSGGGA